MERKLLWRWRAAIASKARKIICMNIKRILLTGDDGYNSIGTRLLVYFLKDRYELAIAGTKTQMSGVGGHVNVVKGGAWGMEKVDGIPALWVNTYPADAIHLSVGFFKHPFDLVISGINLGLNVGLGIISSGTFAAAATAMSLRLANRAVVMSLDTHYSHYFKDHDGAEDMTDYIDYPGSVVYDLLERAIAHDFWGATVLNVNLPYKKTRRIRFTKPLPDLKLFYEYPMRVDKNKHTFAYPKDKPHRRQNRDRQFDSGAVLNGLISVSLYQSDFIREDSSRKFLGKEMEL